jgi:hypothetical protein
MWYVQFYHGWFGWLTLDESPYATREAAEQAAKVMGASGGYRRRVRFIERGVTT